MTENMLTRSFKSILFSAVLLIAPAVQAQYVQSDKIFVEGETIDIPLSGAESLTVTYRPGSKIAEKETILADNSMVTWKPKTAGIVALSTPDGPVQTVSVRFREYPFSGFVILILAAGILFGGAGFSAYKLFGKTSPDDLANRPDT